MSRSYRKNEIVKDRNKNEKRFANKKIRRSTDIPNGKKYKKFYPQYDICDWIVHCSYEDYLKSNKLEDSKSAYKDWYTIFKRK